MGLGFRGLGWVYGVWFMVYCLGFRIQALGVWIGVDGLRFRVKGLQSFFCTSVRAANLAEPEQGG